MNWSQLYIEIFLLYVECNLPCLMTSDKDYLGKGNIDRFDALYFHAFYANTDDKGKKENLTVSFLTLLVQWPRYSVYSFHLDCHLFS